MRTAEKSRKLLNIFIIILIFISIIFGSVYYICYVNHSTNFGQKDKAIILIPGLYGSALMKPESKESYWSLNLDAYYGIMNKEYGRKLYEVDDEQNFLLEVTPATMDNANSVRYSLLNVLTPLYKSLKKSLKKSNNDEYEVVVWQYDWRQSNAESAEKLEEFINEKGYEKVVLAGHSMGGVVISNYLAKEQNREKVELFVPICSPLLGSGVMSYYQTNDCDYSLAKIMGIDVYKMGCNNMPSIHQMLLVNENLNYEYYNNNDAVCDFIYRIDGEVKTPEEFNEYFLSTSIFQNSKGEVWPSVANLDDYNNRLFYEDEQGNSIHISHKVNTYYVVGVDINTIVGLDYDTENNYFSKEYRAPVGDNLLTWYSGTAGTPLDSENVYAVSKVTHYKVPSENYVVENLTSKISELWNQ